MKYKRLFDLFWWKFQNIIKSFRCKWEKYKWWTPCMIITPTVVLILYYAPSNEYIENVRYILSAISQVLAAILALVFAIAMVAAQMTGGYTAMDKIILKPITKFLMIFFGIGIITPLLVLEFGFWKWGVPFSIVVANFCVFSLLPFLISVNRTIKYDIGIVNLNEEITEAIESGYEPKASKIRELSEIGKDAVRELREDDAMKILSQLSIIGKESAEKRFKYATPLVADRLIGMGIGSIKKGFDDMTVKIAVIGLENIGVEAVKNRLEGLSEVVPKAIDGLTKVGTKAAEEGLAGTTIRAVKGLKDVIVEYRYLFSWNNVPGTDNERLLRYLITYHDIDWAKSAEIRKSDDGKTIYIFEDGNSAEITIDEAVEMAILKINDDRIHDLEVKKENYNIYKVYKGNIELKGERDKYIDMLKEKKNKIIAVDGVLWCLGAFVTERMSTKEVDMVIRNLKEIEKEIGRELLMERGKNCVNEYPHLKSYFEEFKRRYD
jgi:hypothetical protein